MYQVRIPARLFLLQVPALSTNLSSAAALSLFRGLQRLSFSQSGTYTEGGLWLWGLDVLTLVSRTTLCERAEESAARGAEEAGGATNHELQGRGSVLVLGLAALASV